ncbi:MAG: porphobilinogen synthase, partial [Dehalococcoidia bacterium]
MTIDITTRQSFARFRRLRRNEGLRGLVRETTLAPGDFVYPLFVVHGQDVREEIASMPGQYHLSLDRLPAEAEELRSLGVRAVLLFGLPAAKDDAGSEAYAEDGITQQAVRALKAADAELVVITDVCLCEYTSHGHCGVIVDGDVDNDSSLELIARTAVSHARAGADLVAPSDMMDGRVAAIRAALDEDGLESTPILSYAAKYASAFYGPFREAAESAPQFGDRRGYQMDPPNAREALRE